MTVTDREVIKMFENVYRIENGHVIVGKNGMCLCGVNSKGQVVRCEDLIGMFPPEEQSQEVIALKRDRDQADKMMRDMVAAVEQPETRGFKTLVLWFETEKDRGGNLLKRSKR